SVHARAQETRPEVGLARDGRRHVLSAYSGEPVPAAQRQQAQSVYYSALTQFQGEDKIGALLAAWNTLDPSQIDPVTGAPDVRALFRDPQRPAMRTGLFMLDAMPVVDAAGAGPEYPFPSLPNGAAEALAGA